jgi:hypothetical protein
MQCSSREFITDGWKTGPDNRLRPQRASRAAILHTIASGKVDIDSSWGVILYCCQQEKGNSVKNRKDKINYNTQSHNKIDNNYKAHIIT